MKTQTKQIAKEIAGDARKALANTGKATLKGITLVACKASYPILGNLSNNLQTRIENAVGKEHYNAEDAFGTTLAINTVIYSGLGGYLSYENPDGAYKTVAALCGGFIGFAYGHFEGFLRDLNSRWDFSRIYDVYEVMSGKPLTEEFHQPAASLPGKIASFPFDALTYVYDSGKNYLQKIKIRIQTQERAMEGDNE